MKMAKMKFRLVKPITIQFGSLSTLSSDSSELSAQAEMAKRELSWRPLAEGPYRDDNHKQRLRIISKFVWANCDNAVERALFISGMFSHDPTNRAYATVSYQKPGHRIEPETAGKTFASAFIKDSNKRGVIKLFRPEELYLIAVSLLRRTNINAYPVYFEGSGDSVMAICMLGITPDVPLSFIYFGRNPIEVKLFEILGDSAATAILYAIATWKVIDVIDEISETGILNVNEVSKGLLIAAMNFLRLAQVNDPTCRLAADARMRLTRFEQPNNIFIPEMID